MNTNQHLAKTYTDRHYKHATLVRHKGVVVAFAMDAARRIYYTALDLEQDAATKGPLDANYWLENPNILRFPNEIEQIGFSLMGATRLPIVAKDSRAEENNPGQLKANEIDPFLSSTARLTADAPFHVLSDNQHIYIFRQSIDVAHIDAVHKLRSGGASGDLNRPDEAFLFHDGNKVPLVDDTLLVDRFVLAGTQLKPVMEVRYKRSRHKTRPAGNKDSLGAKDMEGNYFFEPTHELDFVRHLTSGHFSVLLLPTQVADVQRWQVFAHNSRTGRIDSFNIERDADGLFNTRGTQFYTSPDPQYQDAVFERQPGTCPFTQQALVPIVSQEGYAESALSFDGKGASAIATGYKGIPGTAPRTVEAWIKTTQTGGSVIEWGSNATLQRWCLRINDTSKTPGALRAEVRDGSIISSTSVNDGRWHHIACTFGDDGSTDLAGVKLYVDGVLDKISYTAAKSVNTGDQMDVMIGSNCNGKHFEGQIDEVRIWERARGLDEIHADMKCRLVGNEPGLAAYWRFDESAGEAFYDQTANARHGVIQGAVWVTSDAPVGDHAGMRRTSFAFKDRSVESGLATLLYHQQEDAQVGYGGEVKPMKKNARVMLALTTGGPGLDGEPTDKKYIAALDFALTREGKLAQTPDIIDLGTPLSKGANEDLVALQELEQQAAELEAQIGSAAPDDPVALPLRQELAGKQAEIALLRGKLDENVVLPMHPVHTDPYGLTLSGGLLGFAYTNDTPYLFDSATGRLALYFRGASGQLFAAYYDTKTSRTRRKLAAGAGQVGFVARSAGAAMDQVAISVEAGSQSETCTVVIDNPSSGITETWPNVSRDPKQFAATLNGQAGNPVYLGKIEAVSGKTGKLALTEKPHRAVPNGTTLLVGDTKLTTSAATTRGATSIAVTATELNADADTSVYLLAYDYSAASVNKTGYSLHKGSLQFMVYPPQTNDQVENGAAEIAGNTPTCQWVADAPGQTFDFYGNDIVSIGPEKAGQVAAVSDLTVESWVKPIEASEKQQANSSAISFDGKNSFVEIEGGGVDVGHHFTQEAWILPTMNDNGFYAFLGTKTSRAEDRAPTLTVVERTKIHGGIGTGKFWHYYTTGNILQHNAWNHVAATFDGTHYKVYVNGKQAFVKNWSGLKSIKTPIKHIGRVGGFFKGAMDDVRLWNYVRSAEEIQANMNRRLRGDEIGLLGYWRFIDGQVRNHSVSGKNGNVHGNVRFVDSPPAFSSGTDGGNGTIRVVHQCSTDSHYTLGLMEQRIQSALAFDGGSHYVDCGNRIDLRERNFTIEFWAKLNRTGSDQYILNQIERGSKNKGLHIGFRSNNRFTFDFYGNELATQECADTGWHHWCCVYDHVSKKKTIYRDGERLAEGTASEGFQGKANFLIGHNPSIGWLSFQGQVDEVRVWETARSETDVQTHWNRRFYGGAAGLLGCWRFEGGEALDHSGNGHDGKVHGKSEVVSSPLSQAGYQIFAGLVDQFLQSESIIPEGEWSHLAASFNQSYALEFDGQAWLDGGANTTLNITQDLTLAAFLKVDRLGKDQGILIKGALEDGAAQHTPYSLRIDAAGKLVFVFEDANGNQHAYQSNRAINAGQFCKIAVTRKRGRDTAQNKVTKTIQGESIEVIESVDVNEWSEIRFYINGAAAGSHRYEGPDSDGHNGPLQIGRISPTTPLYGVLSEVRIWNAAREPNEINGVLNGSEQGLVSWWRFEENQGNLALDSKGENHATIQGAHWVKTPDPQGSPAILYLNGAAVKTKPVEASDPLIANGWGDEQFSLGSRADGEPGEFFSGSIEEVRVWRTARTQEQILDNLFTRLKGEKQDLLAYYTFDETDGDELQDYSLLRNHLAFGSSRPNTVLSTAPISSDAAQVRSALAGVRTPFHETIDGRPAVAEYGDMQRDSEGNVTGVLKRCYAYIQEGRWQLITGYKVGNLTTEWVGQVQYDPQVVGFIEGVPPVPSENLTEGALNPSVHNYATIGHISNIELVESDTVTYSLSSSKEQSFDMGFSASASFGGGSDEILIAAPMGFGIGKQLTESDFSAGLSGNFDTSNGWSSEESQAASINHSKSMSVAMGAGWESADPQEQYNPYIGRRLVPGNVGFALVQSETADIFAVRLAHNNALVSFRMQPNPDIPKDWNIIPFPINPRYTKQGCLDGMVGYDANGSKVLDADYTNAAGYGEYSYFKPREAYAVKRRIQQAEQQRLNYYASFDTAPAKTGQIVGAAAGAAAGVLGGSAGMSMGGGTGSTLGGLVEGLTGNPKLPQKYAKRDLINTYVWTADGGFFAETTETTDVKSESTSGSFSFSGEVGGNFSTDVEVFSVGFSLEFEASVGGSLNVTKTRAKETEKAFSIEVELDTPGDLQGYTRDEQGNYHGDGMNVPGKVDAYRFMTFYLDSDRQNFEDLFSKVVDPVWLEQSDHPNAVAMRQAHQVEKKPACWRLYHRVTFVSRILPEFESPTAPPLEKALKAQNIDSNWQLIQTLSPFVKNATDNFALFSDAVHSALGTYLPELLPHEADIIQYMALYLGVNEEV